MSVFSLKDTAAYQVVDQMVSHMWPSSDWSENDLMCVYVLFSKRGGSWEGIMDGDPAQMVNLENAISDYMNYRSVLKAAKNLV